MGKYIYGESNGLWYELQGDYYIPCLKLPDEEQKEIGVWGLRHEEYLKSHRKATYNRLLFEGKLNSYRKPTQYSREFQPLSHRCSSECRRKNCEHLHHPYRANRED